MDRLCNDTAQAANHEAAILGSLRGQISELQNILNGMGHQLAAEQAMRRADGQAFDMNMKAMEASIQAAQEGIVNRTVSMIESKAQGFIKAIKELEVRHCNGVHLSFCVLCFLLSSSSDFNPSLLTAHSSGCDCRL